MLHFRSLIIAVLAVVALTTAAMVGCARPPQILWLTERRQKLPEFTMVFDGKDSVAATSGGRVEFFIEETKPDQNSKGPAGLRPFRVTLKNYNPFDIRFMSTVTECFWCDPVPCTNDQFGNPVYGDYWMYVGAMLKNQPTVAHFNGYVTNGDVLKLQCQPMAGIGTWWWIEITIKADQPLDQQIQEENQKKMQQPQQPQSEDQPQEGPTQP